MSQLAHTLASDNVGSGGEYMNAQQGQPGETRV